MRNRRREVALTLLAGVLALAVVASIWAVKTGSSEAQQDVAADYEWTLVVDGLVQSPLTLTFEDLVAMPTTTVFAELYCVGDPVNPLAVGNWTGVRLGFILNQAGVLPEAWKVAFYADDGFSTDLPLTIAMGDDIILAYERDGEPLILKQLVVPCKWGYKWIMEPTHIELVDYDFLGRYESMGYSDEANRTPGDTDCDGVADGDDNCESAFNPDQTNSDGHDKGDACDTDDDDDGWEDSKEIAAGSDPLDPNSTPDVCDGQDNDGDCPGDSNGDGVVCGCGTDWKNETYSSNCDEGVDEDFEDNDGNGAADCYDNKTTSPDCVYDADGDTLCNAEDGNDDNNPNDDPLSDADENYIGTDKDVMCSPSPYSDDNDPFDIFIDGKASIFDIMQYIAADAIGAKLADDDPEYDRRFDLYIDGEIDIFDIMQYIGSDVLNKTCPYGL